MKQAKWLVLANLARFAQSQYTAIAVKMAVWRGIASPCPRWPGGPLCYGSPVSQAWREQRIFSRRNGVKRPPGSNYRSRGERRKTAGRLRNLDLNASNHRTAQDDNLV